MKPLFLFLAITALSPLPVFAGGGSSVGIGNPASAFCENLGGKLESQSNEQGEYANCVIEEWSLWRSMNDAHLVKPIRCEHPNMPCMPNPASKNCVDIGGTLRPMNSPQGQYSMCVVEEWALWRVFHSKNKSLHLE